ncbi:MAG: OmpA family protein [Planctomycetaceae bacterium]|jgi:chemotaxis protein MotB|nr:OmpA family protein [Planctomycetaceae bacterium]
MTVRSLVSLAALTGFMLSSGCYVMSDTQMRMSQARSMQMSRNQQFLAGRVNQLASEKAGMEQQLAIANQRLNNLNAERAALHDRYKHLLATSSNPLPGGATARFRELAERYPEFEFDPETGVSKFNTDLLFALGSDEIRPEAQDLLKEFASIMNSAEAQQFNILVTGHTDDVPIKKASTKAKHESNWELSAHRGTAVIHALAGHGMAENRMGVAGYSMYQPVAPNSNDSNRQKNRRVEIYVLAPDAAVVGG